MRPRVGGVARVGRRGYPDKRAWTRANSVAEGCAESMATLILRAETVTRAPILSSRRRSVPAVARASRVPRSAWRQGAEEEGGEGGEEEPELVGGQDRGGVPSQSPGRRRSYDPAKDVASVRPINSRGRSLRRLEAVNCRRRRDSAPDCSI